MKPAFDTMKTASILGFCSVLAGLVAAAPLDKRDYAYVTVTHEVVEVVDVTVTVTVDPTSHPYSWSWSHEPATTAATTTTTSSSSSSEAPVQTANEVSQDDKQEDNYAPSVSEPDAPAPAATEPAVVDEPAPAEAEYPTTTPTPEPSTSSSTTTTTEQPSTSQVETPKPSEPAPAPTTNGGQYSGELTFYDTGLGACGWVNDGTVENVVALAHGFMGTQSNGNPYCGRMIEVFHGGKSVKAKVVDKCMGCSGMDIDLSPVAFGQVADYSEGRVDCTWSFID